jgi:4-coumarate--CoA ligase
MRFYKHWDELRRKNEVIWPYRTIIHLPVAHIGGVIGAFITPEFFGTPIFWMKKYDFNKFIHFHRVYRITYLATVPSIALQIAKFPEVTNHFDEVKEASIGSAPLDRGLQREVQKRLGKGKCCIGQTWGLTETASSVTYPIVGEGDNTGSVGTAYDHVTIR